MYRVSRKDLKKGTQIEQGEHQWASERTARRIARNHLQQHGPGYYRGERVTDEVIKSFNRKLNARPIRKRRAPRPFNPLYDSPF
jgi:hypothetical protein